MITKDNYLEHIDRLGLEQLPPLLRDFHNDLKEGTSDFTDWSVLEDKDILESTQLYFKELEALKKQVKEPAAKQAKTGTIKAPAEKKTSDKYYVGQKVKLIASGQQAIINKIFTVKSGGFVPGQGAEKPTVEYSFSIKTQDSIKTVNEGEITPLEETTHAAPSDSASSQARLVENTSEDVKYIKSFVALHNRSKTHMQLRSLLTRLQKAITHRLINKDSSFASEIATIQDRLIKLVKVTEKTGGADIKIDSVLLEKLSSISGGEKVYNSISYLKRYIGMQAKPVEKDKASSFVKQADKALTSGKISKDDPYVDRVKNALKTVKNYIAGKDKVVSITKTELNGLKGIVEGCGCGLQGIEEPKDVVSSMDFVNVKFDTLGFKGKWLDLIGDPSPGFSAMIYGKPKFGKSYLCIAFAGYLAKHHGKVLYVASEEDLFITLQKKVRETGVADPNLFLTGSMPGNISSYSFVFLDSLSKLGLTPEDLTRLEKQYPTISFIYVFHVRKDGNFKGRNDFQHDVDIVIEVPEKGHAVQYGRFNQGGEMDIFDYEEAA